MGNLQENWVPVFPARTTRRLRYSTSASITGTAGVVGTYIFSANGLYDPDVTGTGHQPMGFDQLMLSYNHYFVTAAKIYVGFRNSSVTNPNVAIRVVADATATTVVDTIMEYGLLNTDVLDYKGTSGSVKRLTESVSIRKIQGVDDILDCEELGGTAATNPVEQTYFHIVTWDISGTNYTVLFDVVIEYTAVFVEPRLLTPSLTAAFHAVLLDEQKTCVVPAGKQKTPFLRGVKYQ